MPIGRCLCDFNAYVDVTPTGFKIMDEMVFYTDAAPMGLKTVD